MIKLAPFEIPIIERIDEIQIGIKPNLQSFATLLSVSKLKTLTEQKKYTLLYCSYTTSPKYCAGWWVNIYCSSFVVNRLTGEKIKMVQAINIPYAPQKHYLRFFGNYLDFILVFPEIPKNWIKFDFIENYGKNVGFTSKKIIRNNTGIYNVVLESK